MMSKHQPAEKPATPAKSPSIWSRIIKIIDKYDMSSSLPYRKFDEFLELRESKEIKVYLNDGTHEKFTITPSSTSVQICSQLLGDKYGGRLDWSIVEVWREEGIERTLEYHENLLKVYRKMENGNKDGNRVFMFRLADKMFDMYIYPHAYSFLYKSYELDKKTEDKIIQKVLNGDMDPLHYNQVWIYDSQKTDPMWKQTILFLKNKKLYFASSYRSLITPIKNADNGCLFNSLTNPRDRCQQLEFWCSVSSCKVFICSTNRTKTDAPSKFCFCLVTNSGLKQYIACETKLSLSYWMCAMRLSKYGKQLRDNYRSFVKRQNDPNEYEYNKKPLPNESIRSHVAMDFKGNVGRIVEDPIEAQAIAQAESGSTRRSYRNNNRNANPVTTPGLQVAVTRLEQDVHLSQPWYHKNMSRDQAANVLNGLGNKDGVFLIRESGSKFGSYVLTYKNGGKIIHSPIAAQMDSTNEQVYFTLDNGVTKFYDLLQLVEFHQLNAGCLPTRLMHYVVQVPITK